MTSMNGQDKQLIREKLKPKGAVEKYSELLRQDIKKFQLNTGELEFKGCPVCGCFEGNNYGKKYGYEILKCMECSMVHVNPRPSARKLNQFYKNSEASRFFQESIIKPTENYRIEKIVKPRLDYINSSINEVGDWLDVGCSSGILLAVGKNAGWSVHGIEFEEEAAESARSKGIIVYEKPLEEMAFEDKFQLITMFEVLEHISDPAEILKHSHRANKQGGYLLITVPNIEGFEFQTIGLEHSNICPPSHLNYYSPTTLSRALISCGYKIITVSTPGLLDIDNVRTAFLFDERKSTGNIFLDEIIRSDGSEAAKIRDSIQEYISMAGKSGNLRILARK
jgi:2-polyprenyl-3-methyl-5-hydroxy-6-metoxy-1,4-benzoquinol methylase